MSSEELRPFKCLDKRLLLIIIGGLYLCTSVNPCLHFIIRLNVSASVFPNYITYQILL